MKHHKLSDTEDVLEEGKPGDESVQQILRIARGLRFGSIEIVVHEGKVVQIERREKLRFGR
jgi:hypothetical protein